MVTPTFSWVCLDISFDPSRNPYEPADLEFIMSNFYKFVISPVDSNFYNSANEMLVRWGRNEPPKVERTFSLSRDGSGVFYKISDRIRTTDYNADDWINERKYDSKSILVKNSIHKGTLGSEELLLS